MNPLGGPAAELFVIGQFGLHLFEDFWADELGGLFSAIDIVELVVGAVPTWVLGVFAAAAGFAADIVLAGKTAWTHRSLGLELALNLSNSCFEILNGLVCLHIR